MTHAILFMLLATGEAGEIAVDPGMCKHTAAAVAMGETVSADLEDGRRVKIVQAACFALPAHIGTCEDDA